MAVRQHRETVVVPAPRGTIFDRNGEPLAIGEQAMTVYANPRQISRPRELTLVVAKALQLQPAEVYPLLDGPVEGVRLPRPQDRPAGRPRRSEKLDLPGLGFYPEELRTYPQRRVASQVLGFAGMDNRGLEGLERSLDKASVGSFGEPDRRQGPARPCARRRQHASRDSREERSADVDNQIQANAEAVLAETVRRYGAKAATAIVMDPVHGSGPRHGRRAGLQREPLRDDARRSPPEPGRHGHVRARIDLQARDHHRRPRRTASSRPAPRSGFRRRFASPTASSTSRTPGERSA